MSKAISRFNKIYSKIRSKIRGVLSPRIVKVTSKQKDTKQFYLNNPPYQLETEIYWQGFDKLKWEIKTRLLWSVLCRKSNTILDIGANSGIYSILAKVYNNEASVYAFEPQTNVYNVLIKNNEINNFNIHCQQLALSDRNGTVPFYNYGNDTFGKNNTTAGSLNKSWRKNDQKSIIVQVDTLDSFINSQEVKNIDLIKIDVESYEPEVLEGYKNHINLHRPFIIIEIIGETTGKKIEAFFEGKNYIYYNIDEVSGISESIHLGIHEYYNYFLCPSEKRELIAEEL